MELIYLETTFSSLLVADPSRDLLTAANQQATREWCQMRRFLITRNCRHLANAQILRTLRGEADRLTGNYLSFAPRRN